MVAVRSRPGAAGDQTVIDQMRWSCTPGRQGLRRYLVARSALGGYRKSLKEKQLQGTDRIRRLTSDNTRGAATSYARSAATSYAGKTDHRRRRPAHPPR